MPGSRSIVMALPMTLWAGLLMFSSVQASDLSGDTGKFMAHHLNHMERGARPEALSGVTPIVDGPFNTYSDRPADKEHEKLLTNESNKSIALPAIGIALLSIAAMLGVRMRRGMQQATTPASSGGHGIDMSIPMAAVSGGNTLDCKSERALAKVKHTAWDPLGLGEGAPAAHVKHGQIAMTAVFFLSPSSSAAPRGSPLAAYNDYDEKGMRKFRWNMNVGREPWGFAVNAEVWNGRIAMMGFFWVLIQEAIQGKGCITTIRQAQGPGELIVPIGIASTFFIAVAAVTTVIARGDGDDFSTEEILGELKTIKEPF